jgi:Rhodopirellula transposase DDE domain
MASTVQIMGLGGSVISVDTRKKELIGEFKNAGRERRPRASRWLSHA